MPHKLSQFWQELKRRKVIRVITVYAAAAFVILELVDIISEPFGLPDWTLKLVIVILSIGLVVSVILSWIYDIHPEGGIVKTEPAHKAKPEEIPKSSNSWKIASYISFVVIIALIVLHLIPRSDRNRGSEVLDKSIAVLPFDYLSDNPDKRYQADGVMDAIVLHLSKIEDLRVISRTSVEQYRDTEKTIPVICEELDVVYILEGSFQMDGDQARLIVQLIQSGQEGHVWGENYDREWKDIFSVQSEVAQAVAEELRARITPEEKQLIEKVPTTNLEAHDFYQRGEEEMWQYSTDIYNTEALENARRYYLKALENDPEYAEVYAGLAKVYYQRYIVSGLLSQSDFDAVLFYVEKALSLDDQLANAHAIKGLYHFQNGDIAECLQEFEKAIELNPNDLQSYLNQSAVFGVTDHARYIYSLQQGASLCSGSELAKVLGELSNVYFYTGFPDQGFRYSEETLELDGDSASYFERLANAAFHNRNIEECLAWHYKCHEIEPENTEVLYQIAFHHYLLDQFEEALVYMTRYLEQEERVDWHTYTRGNRIAYVLGQNGFPEDAEYYAKEQLAYTLQLLERSNLFRNGGATYLDLAESYALLGDKENAFENLRIFLEQSREYWFVFSIWLEEESIFDFIREEPEFQLIVRDYKARVQERREEIRTFLEENDLI